MNDGQNNWTSRFHQRWCTRDGRRARHSSAAEGANVVIGDVLDDAGSAVATSIGDQAMFLHRDVTDEDSCSAADAATVERFGSLSVLISNAGIVDDNLMGQ